MNRRDVQSDSKLLSGFPWPINRTLDNNLESLCTFVVPAKSVNLHNFSFLAHSHILMNTDVFFPSLNSSYNWIFLVFRRMWSWVPGGSEPRITVLAKTSSK
jgi:hypothetical protein